ncbi:MAG TPA: KH domain-containing protein, partial [Candidatus Eisenbacteria bacterium]|nr:KH domain-containing protein [Candidatus Eisenbacteria bacterium]
VGRRGRGHRGVKDLVTYLVKSLVDDPGAVRVREAAGERGGVVEIQVSPADRGRLIGKEGRTIRAIRALVTAAGSRDGRRVGVEILD